MKWKLYWIVVLLLPVLVLAAFMHRDSTDAEYKKAREVIILRKVSHKLLQAAGDSSSRVPEIKKISETEYLLPLETAISFHPDSLVNTINQVIQQHGLSNRYMVNVLEQPANKIVFGYAMIGSEQENIIPCLGREQPVAKYSVLIRWEPANNSGTAFWIAGIVLAFGIGAGLYLKRARRMPKKDKGQALQEEILPGSLSIGHYQFHSEAQELHYGDTILSLTGKETKLLQIFATSLNELVDRKRLQKEVWEDEGVIVGRSLDMYISKLRKKLELDPAVHLINVHGKGYKLEVRS